MKKFKIASILLFCIYIGLMILVSCGPRCQSSKYRRQHWATVEQPVKQQLPINNIGNK